MGTRRSLLTVSIATAAVVIVLVGLVGSRGMGATVLAQAPDQLTGDGAPPVVARDGTGGDGLPAAAGEIVRAPGLGADAAPELSFSYYRLIGAAFQPRTSASTFAYGGYGCIYGTAGADDRYTAPLLLPDGATIKYLRIYYEDKVAQDTTAWISRYQPGVAGEDVTSVSSIGSTGYGEALSPEITHTVDLHDWAYTLTWVPNVITTNLEFCGARVAYYVPSIFGSLMPVVSKQ